MNLNVKQADPKSDTPQATGPQTRRACELALSGNVNGRDWVKEWELNLAEYPSAAKDEGVMLSWFSMALMAGYDAGRTFK